MYAHSRTHTHSHGNNNCDAQIYRISVIPVCLGSGWWGKKNEWSRNREAGSGSIRHCVDFRSGLLCLRNSWIRAILVLFMCNGPPAEEQELLHCLSQISIFYSHIVPVFPLLHNFLFLFRSLNWMTLGPVYLLSWNIRPLYKILLCIQHRDFKFTGTVSREQSWG